MVLQEMTRGRALLHHPDMCSQSALQRPFRSPLSNNSAFRLQSLSLLLCVPTPWAPFLDWLDNDLSCLVGAADLHPHLRAALPGLVRWHQHPAPGQPVQVNVYTDGSAGGASEPLASRPCGWAFNVWVVTDSDSLFYGYAAAGCSITIHCLLCR